MTNEQELTHKGWFYLVPVWCSEDGECVATRWVEWWWPIQLMAAIHNFINWLNQDSALLPLKITGKRND